MIRPQEALLHVTASTTPAGHLNLNTLLQVSCFAASFCSCRSSMKNRIEVGEMVRREVVETYKKEGPKFMQRLVAKQKADS